MFTLESLSKYALALTISLATCPSLQATLLHTQPLCEGAAPLATSGGTRGHLSHHDEEKVFVLQVTEPGILGLDLQSSGPAVTKLDFLGLECDPGDLESHSLLELTPNHRLLAIHQPGAYFISIRTPAPGQLPLSYRLNTHFATSDVSEALKNLGSTLYNIRSVVADDEVDPDPKSVVADDEVDPDPKSTLHDAKREMCRRGLADDHGNSFTCASLLLLDTLTLGTVEGSPQGDTDLFEVHLERPATLHIALSAEPKTFAELYTREGLRVGKAQSVTDGLDLILPLVPGRYFLKLSAEPPYGGAYALLASADYD